MSRDLKRISLVAVVLLVGLRMCIGWEFLYKGLSKYESQETPKAWSAEGYLKSSVGPFRGTYRGMVGDPDGLNWLNYQHMTSRWDAWSERFADHYFLSRAETEELKKRATAAEAAAKRFERQVSDLDPSQADSVRKLPLSSYAAELKPLTDDPKTRTAFQPLLEDVRALERRAKDFQDAEAAAIVTDAKATAERHAAAIPRLTKERIQLDEHQREDLKALLAGYDEFTVKLDRLPEAVDLTDNPDTEFAVPLASHPEEAVYNGSLGGNIDYRPGELFIPPGRAAKLGPEQWDRLHRDVPKGETEYHQALDRLRVKSRPLEGRIAYRRGELYIPKGQEGKLGEAQFLRLRDAVTREAEPEYHAALDRLERMLRVVSYKALLAEYLKEDPEWTGKVTDADGNLVEAPHTGKLARYREGLQQYERALAEADQDFEREHLKKKWSDLQALKAELVPTVQGLEGDLKTAALDLLTPGQRTMPAQPEAPEPIDTVNWLTIWSLIVLGVLLIAGLLTRVAALLGAGMMLSFYLVAPPWPGVPVEQGPEYAVFVNEILIRAVALLALVCLPTGSWFGLDGLFRRLFSRPGRTRGTQGTQDTPPAAKATTASASEPKPAATAAP